MKLRINQIAPGGISIAQDVAPQSLDLETDQVRFCGPVKIRAEVSIITNAVTADISLEGLMSMNCSRCLEELKVILKKKLRLNYAVDNTDTEIDLGPDIRQEIILDYPLKPLCQPDCKGLCPKCGGNLNQGACRCRA